MRKINAVLGRRQFDLAVVMENVHKPHNLAAIARSCDAVGAMGVHAVGTDPAIRLAQKSASGVTRWIDFRLHRELSTAYKHCRDRGMQLVALTVAADSHDFRALDYTSATAFVVGAELPGLSTDATAECDAAVHIPMFGMVDSLNVSVATALVLFEARRQREAKGLYDSSSAALQSRAQLAFEWAQPQVADYCRRHGLSYPPLDEFGDIVNWSPSRQRGDD